MTAVLAGVDPFAALAAALGRRLRIGSLFTGMGALDLAVEEVTGGEVVWVCENEDAPSRILAHRFPDRPNLGDITAVNWHTLQPVDVMCGGFPCTDVSSAGKRAGIAPDTRSGLWAYFREAIRVLRPRYVLIENVYGLLTTKAERSPDAADPELDPLIAHLLELADAEAAADPPGDDLGSDDTDVGDDDGTRPVLLRALGAVLGDLADLGYDAVWTVVAASDVGADHRRRRVFILAWDGQPVSDADGSATARQAADAAGSGRGQSGGDPGQRGGEDGERPAEPDRRGATPADARGEAVGLGTGLRPAGPGRVGRGRPDDDRVSDAADTDGPRREGAESAGRRLMPAGGGRADTAGRGDAAHAAGERGTEGLTETARVERGPHADERDPAAPGGRGDASPADPGRGGFQRWTDAAGVGGEAHSRAGEGIQRERRGDAAGGRGAVPADPGSERCDRGQDSDRTRRHEDERDEACDRPRGGAVAATPADTGRDGRSLERVEGERPRREGAPRNEPDRRAREGGTGDDYDRRFGPYAAAVRRWSALLGRRAPDPTEAGAKGGRRLNPAFVEHMMGLPAGWVTSPAVWRGYRGNARNAQLKALGNGVVPRQAASALRILAVWHVAAVSGDASEINPPTREEVSACG